MGESVGQIIILINEKRQSIKILTKYAIFLRNFCKRNFSVENEIIFLDSVWKDRWTFSWLYFTIFRAFLNDWGWIIWRSVIFVHTSSWLSILPKQISKKMKTCSRLTKECKLGISKMRIHINRLTFDKFFLKHRICMKRQEIVFNIFLISKSWDIGKP